MTSHKTVSVTIPRALGAYNILIGDNLLAQTGLLLSSLRGASRVIIVTDSNVAPLYLPLVELALREQGHNVLPSVIIPAGESLKSIQGWGHVLESFFARDLDRHTVILALGGGVVGDLAGFAAATALRGLPCVQIPTTLLSQVDSSVGGKNGINSQYGKNTIGTFSQPIAVWADTNTLNTLPRRELLAGYAEVVKYGLIEDFSFFEWCEQNASLLLSGDPIARNTAIAHSCKIKASIVAQDEREAGKRALLNLGHTFGHALETATGYSEALLHGEGVALGTLMAFDLAVTLGYCSGQDRDRVHKHFKAIGLPLTPPPHKASIDELIGWMHQDKKVRDGKLVFILPERIGFAKTVTIDDLAPVRTILGAYESGACP